MRMLTARLLTAACAAVMVTGSLAACTPPAPTPSTRTPVATPSPAFSSDAEALKAATDAYAAYLKMSDTILSESGRDPGRFAEVATGDALVSATDGVLEYQHRELHSTGTTRFDSAKLQKVHQDPTPSVSIYVCDDVGGIDVLDSLGHSIVKPDRKPRTPFVVTVKANEEHRWLVANRILWDGESFC